MHLRTADEAIDISTLSSLPTRTPKRSYSTQLLELLILSDSQVAVGGQCTTLVRGEGDLKTEKIKFVGVGGWNNDTWDGADSEIDSNQQYTVLYIIIYDT